MCSSGCSAESRISYVCQELHQWVCFRLNLLYWVLIRTDIIPPIFRISLAPETPQRALPKRYNFSPFSSNIDPAHIVTLLWDSGQLPLQFFLLYQQMQSLTFPPFPIHESDVLLVSCSLRLWWFIDCLRIARVGVDCTSSDVYSAQPVIECR